VRLLVVGAGSTGCYFGGRVAQAGRDVTFLVRPARAAKLRQSGSQIVSPHCDATIQPSKFGFNVDPTTSERLAPSTR
jgi:2-dehydropantoate 2-reductase